MNIMLKKIKKEQAGTTLLELIVAMSLFTILVLSVTQIFNLSLKVGRNVLASQGVQSEMRYLFEVVSKEIRMAKVDKNGVCITRDRLFVLPNGNQELKFLNKDGECVNYSLIDGNFSIKRDIGGASSGEIELNSDEIVVENLEFRRFGYIPVEQPMILFKMTVYNKNDPGKKMRLQTTISSRDYE
jgi:type II secretory pathway pseudopilin PulG